jgi:serine/threonine protein kinase
VQFVQFDFIVHVSSNPTPNVDPARHSAELHELIGVCLRKRPAERPSATQLLTHPFVRQHAAVKLEVRNRPRFFHEVGGGEGSQVQLLIDRDAPSIPVVSRRWCRPE